jgi:hypothetical protein
LEDQQLIDLIYRYDSNMSQADQEYLLSVQNREAVVRTLQAKILEREGDYGEEDSEDMEKQAQKQYNHATQDSSERSEEQSPDPAFEEELNAFRCSISPRQKREVRKLVPNVSQEWIRSLKTRLAEQSYCASSLQQQSVGHYKLTRMPCTGIKSGVYCMTTSTGGTVMSFNSPRATERQHGYEIYTDESTKVRSNRGASLMNI